MEVIPCDVDAEGREKFRFGDLAGRAPEVGHA